ncbi:MAG: CDP-alcohol phosphatidyltransferase family protein [Candidatus Aminicenantes bacterium]|nr:CDP-alcohol phosphatidyltransferase family protein [Candidatus Aminicenantes bacterium]MCK5004056.1 CDP-alcohol phosphatidyltransferase family protein [Candidatus Aminicenantes bacterium]
MNKLFKEFRSSLKDIVAEEATDLFLFRPVSFVFTKFLVKLPVTPNQVSFMSMIAGIISGIFFSFGDKKSFIYGGLFYLLCHIFDLIDGMIARLKKNGTPLGRIIDGWVDYITSVAVFIGLYIGFLKGKFDLPFGALIITIAAGASMILHSVIIDYYRQQYLSSSTGRNKTISEDYRKFQRRFHYIKSRRGNYIEKLLLFVYLGYTKVQVTGTRDKAKVLIKKNTKASKILLVFWNMIGVSTHRFFLILGVLLYQPMIFFFYVIVFCNVLLLVLYPIQWKVDKREDPVSDRSE